jgi:hypothetical protein
MVSNQRVYGMETRAESLAAIRLLRVCVTLWAQDPLQLPPYRGSTLRGGFGTVFKETVCVVEHRDCARCLLCSRCACPYVFNTPVSEEAARLRKYTAAPYPFVFLPPLEEKTLYRPGETLAFDLTLIGKGTSFGLGKYASFIPSATPWEADEEYRTLPDISLYDHLKVVGPTMAKERRNWGCGARPKMAPPVSPGSPRRMCSSTGCG